MAERRRSKAVCSRRRREKETGRDPGIQEQRRCRGRPILQAKQGQKGVDEREIGLADKKVQDVGAIMNVRDAFARLLMRSCIKRSGLSSSLSLSL